MACKLKYKLIAVDFDGTIATIKPFPQIGDLISGADEVIRKIKTHGGKVAIWTCRGGEDEIKVKDFLAEHNIPWDKFNEDFDESIEEFGTADSRKIFADVYIDERCILWCGIIDWKKVDELLFEDFHPGISLHDNPF